VTLGNYSLDRNAGLKERGGSIHSINFPRTPLEAFANGPVHGISATGEMGEEDYLARGSPQTEKGEWRRKGGVGNLYSVIIRDE